MTSNKIFYKIFIGLVAIIINSNSFAQKEEYSQLGIPQVKKFRPNDYDGESQNWAITQDKDGVMFFGNTIGFMEYDGVHWRQFKPDNDGVPLSFAQDTKGNIYAGGTRFIGMLESDSIGQMYFKSLKSYLPKDFYLDFVWNTHYHNNKVYFQNRENVIVWDGEQMKVIPSQSRVEYLCKTDNRLFVDTVDGLFEVINDSLVWVLGSEILSDISVFATETLSADSILIGSFSNGLFLLIDNNVQPVQNKLNDYLKENFISDTQLLPDGKILIATKKGGALLLNRDLSVYYRIETTGGLTNNDIKEVYLDKDYNIWIGTDNGISFIEYPIEFTFYTSELGVVSTVEEIRLFKNDLVMGSFLGTFKLNPISASQILSDNPYASFKKIEGIGLTNFALYDRNDKLYISTLKGTQVYDGTTVKTFDAKEAREFYQSPTKADVVYAGYRAGCDILIFEGDKLKQRIPIPGLEAQIRGIAEDVDGNLWLGSLTNGVYRARLDSLYNTIELTHFTEDDGLPSMRDNLVYRVRDKVIFTTHNGIFKFESSNNRFVPEPMFGEIYADYSRFIYAFYYDNDDKAWIHAFRKRETGLATPSERGEYDLDLASFTPLNHLQIYEIYKEPERPTAWFGGNDGIARYEPAKGVRKTEFEFPAKIRKVLVNEDSTIFMGHFNNKQHPTILNADENELRFETAGLYFQGANQFQYLLEGYEDDWSSWTEEPFKIYTNLGHGDYTFKVRVKNIKGTVSKTDHFNFEILAPWYLTWWFLLISFIISTTIFVYIIRYFSTRKLIRRVEELELIQKAQRQRERISRDLHDNVGSNLTYIISSLDYITYKSGKNEELADKANDLGEFTRDTMNQLRDTIWHISSEEVSLVKFKKRVEEMCLRMKNISETTHCEVSSKGDLNQILAPIPALNIFRAVQESVNNAFKHASANNINVDIILNNEKELIISINDDGKGFINDETDLEDHYGLANLRSRINDINGGLKIESEEGVGTRIEITLKL